MGQGETGRVHKSRVVYPKMGWSQIDEQSRVPQCHPDKWDLRFANVYLVVKNAFCVAVGTGPSSYLSTYARLGYNVVQ